MVPITGVYGALAALLLLALAINVMRARGEFKVSMGDGGQGMMLRAIRMHGNATEYIPIALIVMALAELNHGNSIALHVAGVALVGGRVAHALGLASKEGLSAGRGIGIAASLLAILIPSVNLLIVAVMGHAA